ncbi:hypothetical protein HMPREF0293_1862 [Corynebacterium glucuronolyticum ATCC 51866]|uniref:Uncharacterized protein n=1 Tax=Corynebacterium glucuronolyticum ATCC 51866 TaxID=548478 RepID=A0ABP2DRW8_9CORY|nr:hypothetical protein HMPREF0293_1862 [Corynebacterium glucuronolyticum ATCC 51866]
MSIAGRIDTVKTGDPGSLSGGLPYFYPDYLASPGTHGCHERF